MALWMLCMPGLCEEAPYRMRLEAAVPIYSGPGYDAGYVRAVGEDGVYTIVSEQWDEEGNLWGRLKSGAGWVNLTALRAPSWQTAPLTACFGEDVNFSGRMWLHYRTEDEGSATQLAFLPRENLYNVQLFRLEWEEEEYPLWHFYCHAAALTPDMPLVAEVVFFGDMTAYAITFQDEAGRDYAYSLSISGRDGSLEMTRLP